MSNLLLKHYFLEEIVRITLEEAILNGTSENEEAILGLDDYEIIELYNRSVKEQANG